MVLLNILTKFNNYKTIHNAMTNMYKNLPAIFLAVAVVSAGSVFAFNQNTEQPQQPTQESGKILGHITMVVKDSDGNVKQYLQTDNKVVNNGLKATTAKLFGNSLETLSGGTAGTFGVVGVGTGTNVPAANDIGLQTQRAAKIVSTPTNNTGTIGAQISATWAAGKLANSTSTTAAITEAGLFDTITNATSSSNMFARQQFSAINVGTADSLQVSWTITFSSLN